MPSNKEFAVAVVDKYIEYHGDLYGALGTLIDDINAHLKAKHNATRNEVVLVDDIFEEIEKLNEAVGIEPK